MEIKKELLEAMGEDVLLLNGFSTLVKCYQNSKDELDEEARDSAEYFISEYLDQKSKKLKILMDQSL